MGYYMDTQMLASNRTAYSHMPSSLLWLQVLPDDGLYQLALLMLLRFHYHQSDFLENGTVW